jgi:hypothetical protein
VKWLVAARIRLTLIRRAIGVLGWAVFGYVPEINHAPDILAVVVPPCPGCNGCRYD